MAPRDKKNTSSSSMSGWDLIWALWQKYRLSLVILSTVLIVGALLIWLFSHRNAEPGTTVKVLAGLVEYTKAKQPDVCVTVEQHKGTFNLSARRNNASNEIFFWKDQLLSDILVQPFNNFNLAANWVSSCYNDSNCANKSHEWLGSITLKNNGAPIDERYKAAIESWWKSIEPAVSARPVTGSLTACWPRSTLASKEDFQFEVVSSSPSWMIEIVVVQRGTEPNRDAVLSKVRLVPISNARKEGDKFISSHTVSVEFK